MLFNSLTFVLFFTLVYSLYRALPHRAQNLMLLAASYLFYASWDWRFLSLILISTVVDFFCGRAIHAAADRSWRRAYLILSVSTNLTLLGFFKYFNFFMDSLDGLVRFFGFTPDPIALKVILPVGISFYTFQTMSYTIDIYRGKLEPEPRALNFALFVAFFPQLVAGPIERATRLLPQIRHPRRMDFPTIEAGLWYLFWGYFLKVFVADNLAGIVNATFNAPATPDGAQVLVATYAFAFQIFGDFAGYSCIAIGIGKLMGFHLMINFQFPYLVTNPRDFWRHWHISLSRWLADYLYVPLGGNRGSRLMLYRNLALTMLLGGLWHGASWTFVIWGAYQGGILILHRLFTGDASSARPLRGIPRIAAVIFMFHLTCVGWLIFRAQSLEQLGSLALALVTDMGLPTPATLHALLQVIFFTWLLLVVQAVQRFKDDDLGLLRTPNWLRAPLLVAMFYCLLIWGVFGGKEFIYFQF